MKPCLKNLKNIFWASIILSLLLMSCGKTNDTLKVGTWKTPQTIQPYFYGNYMDSKIEVFPFTNPGDQKTALLAGQLDVCGTTLVTAIMAASQNEPIVVIAAMGNKCSALVVGINSGIENEADLKEKTIGYVPGTMHHLLLLDILSRNNIGINDVNLIRVDFFDMGQALRDKKIDAFLSGEPYPSIAELEGYGKILCYPYYENGMGTINSALITTRAKIENDPQRIQTIVSSHIRATEFLNSNVDEWVKKSIEFGNSEDVLQFSLNNIELCSNIDQDYINNTKVLAQLMFDLSLISKIPDIEEMFDLNFIHSYER